jgi:hypothetical protein
VAFSFSEQDQIDFGAYGRPLATGRHKAKVVACQEKISKTSGNEMIQVTLSVNPGEEKAPEGAVKIDFYALKNQPTLSNFIETFYPEAKGKAGVLDNLGELAGAELEVLTGWRDAQKNPDGTIAFKAQAEIKRLYGPVVWPKVESVDGQLPF